MAPRSCQVVSSPEPKPSSPHLQAATPQESFNLADVPGSDNNPSHSDSDCSVGINDPDAVPMPKTRAPDIQFFFDKTTEAKIVCKECRYVSYVLNSSVFRLKQ
jgi:hypothetical protein